MSTSTQKNQSIIAQVVSCISYFRRTLSKNQPHNKILLMPKQALNMCFLYEIKTLNLSLNHGQVYPAVFITMYCYRPCV